MNEIDRLMSEDPLNLSAQDLDTIIAFQRKMKANFAVGIKSGKGGAAQSPTAPKIDLQTLLKASLAQNNVKPLVITRRG